MGESRTVDFLMSDSLYKVLRDVLACSSVQEASVLWSKSCPIPARKPSSSLMTETIDLAKDLCPPSPWFKSAAKLCERGDLEAVKLYVQIGGEESLVGIPLPYPRKHSIDHIADPEDCMIAAINSRNCELIKYLLKCGHNINQKSIEYWQLDGLLDFDVCSLLLDCAFPLEEYDQHGFSFLPVMLSESFEGQFELAKRIIPHVDIEAILDSDPTMGNNPFDCPDPRIIELLLNRLDAEEMSWRDGVEIEISLELPYELRLRVLRALTRVHFFAKDAYFEASVRNAGVSLTDLTDLVDHYPEVDFPPKAKSARSAGHSKV